MSNPKKSFDHPCHSKLCGVPNPLGTESYSRLPPDPLLLVRVDIACSRRSDSGVRYEVGEREKNKEDERALTPSGRENVLRKLLRIPYRRLKAEIFCVLTVLVCCWSSE